MGDFIYLDNAATTFPKPESVYAVQDEINRNLAVNAGRGSYRASHRASEIISDCRRRMSKLAGCREDHLIFAPSATIALNQIIMGLPWDRYKTVYVSPYEHNAVIRPLRRACDANGIDFIVLSAAPDGSLDLSKIAVQFAKQKPDYVFMTHVSNVTGYMLPVKAVSELAHAYKAVVVVDCAQSMGLVDAGLASIGADFSIFAGHKTLYGSFGIGGWAAKNTDMLKPVICGGTGSDSLNQHMPCTLPERFEAASPNIIAVAALNEALKWREALGAGEAEAREHFLTMRMLDGLSKNKSIQVYRTEDARVHLGVVSFNHRAYMADELGMILDQDFNISVRAGYHCSPLVHELIGSIPKRGTVRASVGFYSTENDVDRLLKALKELD